MNIKRIIKDTCILFIITIVSGCLLGFVYNSTKDKIAAKQEETKLLAYKQVMSEADDFKADYSKLIQQSSKLLTKDYGKNGIEITNALGAYKDNKLQGYVIQVTDKDGFGGEIELIIGIDLNKQIKGVEILSINETVGLGMNAKNESFRLQYLNKKVDSFVITKTGKEKDNEIDSLSSATITSKAVTTSAMSGMGMGLTTMAVLIMSNFVISALRKIIPERVRIPAYIVIVATLVTVVQLLLQANLPSLYNTLGIYIPLIVVNCIILGRAEAFASKNNPILSILDGVGMGLGFTLALTCIGLVRELLGAGTAFGYTIMPKAYEPISIFIMAPGAFFVLSMLTAIQNKLKLPSATNIEHSSTLECGGDCTHCHGITCFEEYRKEAQKK